MKFFLLITCLLTTDLAVPAQTLPTADNPPKAPGKLANQLRALSDSYQQNKRIDSTLINARLLNLEKSTGRILVNAVAESDTAALRAELRQAGAEIVSGYGRIITCWIPVSDLPALESLKTCHSVRPAYRPRLRSGPVNSQGDSAQRSNLARTQFGVTGQGVKVGVLSDSYAARPGATTGVAAGELPGPTNPNGFTTAVTNVLDYTVTDASDEGRAMLEIVHDVAPGAQLYFRTAFISDTDFANGIQQLANLGCKVVIDDVGYFNEPYFQDGIIAQSVDNVRTNNGVTYFSSAGNSGNVSYENTYQPSVYRPFSRTAITAHNFGTAGNPVYYLPIRLPARGTTILGFQWDQPFFSVSGAPGTTTDLDIYLLSAMPTATPIATSLIVASSEDNNLVSGTGDAVEVLGFDNPTNTPRTYYVLITKYSGPDPTRLKFIEFADSTFPTSATPLAGIGASTCYGHPNAAGAIATGAAPFFGTPAYGINPPQIESFSSRGGTPIYLTTTGERLASPVIRQKPEVTGPDGGNTSFFFSDSGQDPDTFPNFFGTSASAPHLGAVAALMLQANATLTPAAVTTALIASCLDMDDPTTVGFDVGFDFMTGNGLVRADLAVQSVFPTVCASLSSGNWNDAAIWSCGVIPTFQTAVNINSNHTVTINGITAKARQLRYNGTGKISFQNSGLLRFAP